MLVYAGWNFNTLFFIQKLLSKADIPTYSRTVFMPILVGILVLMDGSFIAHLNRVSSAVLYALANFVALYGFYSLYEKLSVPVSDIDAYRTVFYFIAGGVLLFIIGAIVNDIRKRAK